MHQSTMFAGCGDDEGASCKEYLGDMDEEKVIADGVAVGGQHGC